MTIARVALPVAAAACFDYWLPAGLELERGQVVRVKLGPRALIGVVVDCGTSSNIERDRLQPILDVVAGIPPLPADILALAEFVAGYYQEPLGLVLAQMLPPLGRGESGTGTSALQRAGTARARIEPGARGVADAVTLPPPNPGQQDAIAAITGAAGRFAPFLLQGVTGSGKTDVYLAAAAVAIAGGGQVLMLAPEINLTPQLAQRIAAALPGRQTELLHSGRAAGARRRAWLAAASGAADVVLGTRLAVFTPMPRLALIIVDEEQDPSFKQQDGVRYHGRDVAIWRARQRQVPIVLGSATPALETAANVQRGTFAKLFLPERAVASARLPRLTLVPGPGRSAVEGMGQALLDAIHERLQRGEQALVFINRRGYAPSLLCSACGWAAGCPHCSARLVVHRAAGRLRCHHCGHGAALPHACPECGNVDLLPLGQGTQRLEAGLAEHFPTAHIARIDRDSTQRRGAFEAILASVQAGTIDLLVGTQMLAKGHDFPRLTLVGVLGADNALYSADFRATERLATLLFQVAGRAGRAALPGEVIVQTDFPSHPLYRALVAHDYDAMTTELLAERRTMGLPPFGHLALLAAEARNRADVDAFLDRACAMGRQIAQAEALAVDVYDPVPAALARRAGVERGQLLVHADRRSALQRFLPRWRSALAESGSRRVRWVMDVDPAGFA